MNAGLLWAFAAGVPAVLAEYLFRRLPGPYLDYWYLFVPLAVWINYAVCQLVRTPGTSLIDALIVFALATMFTRVAVSVFVLGDAVGGGTWFALGLLIMARIAQLYWGR